MLGLEQKRLEIKTKEEERLLEMERTRNHRGERGEWLNYCLILISAIRRVIFSLFEHVYVAGAFQSQVAMTPPSLDFLFTDSLPTRATEVTPPPPLNQLSMSGLDNEGFGGVDTYLECGGRETLNGRRPILTICLFLPADLKSASDLSACWTIGWLHMRRSLIDSFTLTLVFGAELLTLVCG